jgi:hypothetical protein
VRVVTGPEGGARSARVVLSGRPYPGVTEQLQFDRESGLLLRRSVTTSTPLGPLPEQVDYSDYRDVSGVKVRS